ncbi:MAG: Crp/Fnr family transcriptional regulator [Desulfobacteraceae bacterium]|nr:MAG: Crp/Fnr family transcriptional regulator [Desulfobacteraceae bacterium]
MSCLCEKSIPDGSAISPKCVKDIWLFNEFESEDLAILSSIGRRKTYHRGDAVFRQGDAADTMFLIKSGRIKLSKVFTDGREGTLDYRKAGDTFGENMFGEATRYPVTAWCMEDTYTCGFKKSDFEQMVLEHPAIGLRIIRKQSELIESLSTRLGDMAIPSLEERLYRILINVARDHGIAVDRGVRIQFPLTHEDLSFLTGSHRVTITKAIKKLGKAGKIYKEGRSYILLTATVSPDSNDRSKKPERL